jgi:hypothetical protein
LESGDEQRLLDVWIEIADERARFALLPKRNRREALATQLPKAPLRTYERLWSAGIKFISGVTGPIQYDLNTHGFASFMVRLSWSSVVPP